MDETTPIEAPATREEGYAYGWNGIRPDGRKFGLDPYKFAFWAMLTHPDEYLDEETGLLKKTYIVFTEEDAAIANDPSLAGTVAVTIDPPRVPNYKESAKLARDHYLSQNMTKEADAFQKLVDAFEAAQFA